MTARPAIINGFTHDVEDHWHEAQTKNGDTQKHARPFAKLDPTDDVDAETRKD